jgi:hypothetical protein
VSFARDVLDEADDLGLTWWEHLALVLAVALLTVASRRAGAAVWNKIRAIEWKVEPLDETQRVISDGGEAGDRDVAPAQPTTGPIDPANGMG